ncbi:OmpP1/FadL family transporter [Erythrobacter sp. SD-21]|uniref:OmpP1/FadL family transporter n=1 Tax=Erythrobacter sp. SD-21 TaxID=161528 RepID=UPI000153FE2F|nr:porin [Erythrobacter sp. SD-21]EDL49195.1 long chain fatty acid transport protein [Erythrobacter sp. SD-21]
MTPPSKTASSALAIGLGMVLASPAHAGGFYIQEQSTKEAGRAYSGNAVAADSPATIFFNPAGMTELEGIQVEANAQALFVTARQSDAGTTRSVPGLPATLPVTGSDGGSPFAQPLVVPSIYASAQVTDSLWVGLGVNSPFGVVVDYDEDFFGRYDSVTSDLFTLNAQPSVAYKISDNFSIGAGVDIQYIKVELANAVPNPDPADPDAELRITGDDISVGWNAGFTATFDPVRIGAHYRSAIDHDLEGEFDLSGLTGLLAENNVTTPAAAPLSTPDIATVSVLFGTDTPWRVYGTWRWYNWSNFDEIRVEPEGVEPQVNEQFYRDTYSMALGAEYDVNERLTLRAGTMFDASPITDEFRSTRVPDGDRTWLSVGASYDINDRFSASLAYAHVFVKSEPIDRTDTFFEGTPAAIDARIRSNSSGDADVLAFSLGARF